MNDIKEGNARDRVDQEEKEMGKHGPSFYELLWRKKSHRKNIVPTHFFHPFFGIGIGLYFSPLVRA